MHVRRDRRAGAADQDRLSSGFTRTRTMLPCSSCGSAVGLTCTDLAGVGTARIGHQDEIDASNPGLDACAFSSSRCLRRCPIAPLGHVQLDLVIGVCGGNRHQHLAGFDRPVLQQLLGVPGDDAAGNRAFDGQLLVPLVEQLQLFAQAFDLHAARVASSASTAAPLLSGELAGRCR